ncbi:MAG TPA: hypothetical protein EYN91_13930 [Candidatus Melainabacteria bacterium]|nr:hypothetical protein [Candidatus Melainabacteria bacterium]HIN67594.1 hypothetical protein [Candidatus Obscuribacterales bacterium]
MVKVLAVLDCSSKKMGKDLIVTKLYGDVKKNRMEKFAVAPYVVPICVFTIFLFAHSRSINVVFTLN